MMTDKEIKKLREITSRKALVVMSITLAIAAGVFITATAYNFYRATEFAQLCEVSFWGLMDVDLQASYSGVHVQAIKHLHTGLRDAFMLFYVALCWVMSIHKRKSSIQILDCVDKDK